jgi:hypothetical protein
VELGSEVFSLELAKNLVVESYIAEMVVTIRGFV